MNAATDTSEALATPAVAAPPRPFYWSVRRELWEHRALYLAPLGAAAVLLLGFIFNAVHLPQGLQALAQLQPEQQRAVVAGTYVGLALVIALTSSIAAWFYALDALQGERRDRSVLFWKSMPVSDTTTVLSKFSTTLIVSPAIAFMVSFATLLLALVLSTVIVLIGGASPAPIWSNVHIFQLSIAFLYTLMVMALWYAPIYAWLLLVSSWARRATFLWAVLPPLAAMLFEKLAFDTRHVADMLVYRLSGGLATAFAGREHLGGVIVEGHEASARLALSENVLHLLEPGRFFSNPHLWTGLAVAAAFVAGAVWMRRYREPI